MHERNDKMVVRDRLKEFQAAYEQSNGEDEDIDYIMEMESAIEKKKLKPRTEDFLFKADNVKQHIELAKNLIKELERKQHQILGAIDSEKTLNEERDQLIATIKVTTTYIHSDIKILENTAQQDKFGDTTEDRIKAGQINTLILSFQEVMSEYNKLQMDHRDQCKARIKRQVNICGGNKTAEEIEEMIENGTTNVFHAQLLTDASRDALKDVEARHLEILKLEESITELFEIFQDVAYMVEVQGDMIDNIERNVEATVEAVSASKSQMKKAYKYKRRKLVTLCCPCVALYRSCTVL